MRKFLPTTKDELRELGWDALDVILVSGDAYIDSPFVGVSVIGKVLLSAGFRVGVIGQPDISTDADITRLGTPRLFWGVTAGCIDSMVANRTATNRKRRTDDYTPGGVNDKRPDRAVIVYSNLIRRYFKGSNARPIVLGGIEASLRRMAHYDFWSDTVRRSVLFDAKADYLAYGMAERSIVDVAEALNSGREPTGVRGVSYISRDVPDSSVVVPSYEECAADKSAFAEAFAAFYANNDPPTAKTLAQRHGDRYLVQNPPARYLTEAELDRVYALGFERELHPYHQKDGHVRALDTIRFSISTHRGCYGECSFCAIAVHEGRRVRSRSIKSIVAEAREMTAHPKFKGRISDVGGPSANMYASTCERMEKRGCCPDRSCITPKVCPALHQGHAEQTRMLREVRAVPGVKKAVVASGIRHDMVVADKKHGAEYLRELVGHHVSGQMKIAPEHTEPGVLAHMGKQGCDRAALTRFRELFYKYSKEAGLDQYLTYYLMAAHPGCTEEDMRRMKGFMEREVGGVPEQVQVFTPTPSTLSTLAYWTGIDPVTGQTCFVERSPRGRERQKEAVHGGSGGRGKGRGCSSGAKHVRGRNAGRAAGGRRPGRPPGAKSGKQGR